MFSDAGSNSFMKIASEKAKMTWNLLLHKILCGYVILVYQSNAKACNIKVKLQKAVLTTYEGNRDF